MKTDAELVAEGLHPKDVAWLEAEVTRLEAALGEIVQRLEWGKYKPGGHGDAALRLARAALAPTTRAQEPKCSECGGSGELYHYVPREGDERQFRPCPSCTALPEEKSR